MTMCGQGPQELRYTIANEYLLCSYLHILKSQNFTHLRVRRKQVQHSVGFPYRAIMELIDPSYTLRMLLKCLVLLNLFWKGCCLLYFYCDSSCALCLRLCVNRYQPHGIGVSKTLQDMDACHSQSITLYDRALSYQLILVKNAQFFSK